jgi:hypothetical protein
MEMTYYLPPAFPGACAAEQSLEERLALARSGVIAAYEDYLTAKVSEPNTEKRLQEIETELDAIATVLTDEETRN